MNPLTAQLISGFTGLATTLVVTWFQHYLRSRGQRGQQLTANGQARVGHQDEDDQ